MTIRTFVDYGDCPVHGVAVELRSGGWDSRTGAHYYCYQCGPHHAVTNARRLDVPTRPRDRTTECDSRCLNGKVRCDCRCGGRCHGAGECLCLPRTASLLPA